MTDHRVEFAKAHPEMTLQQVGDEFGITRERVRQICVKADYKHPLHNSGPRVERIAFPCTYGGCLTMVEQTRGNSRQRCEEHAPVKGGKWTEITCAECGKVSKRLQSVVNSGAHLSATRVHPQENFFCDRYCHGKYSGENFGWGAHLA